MNSHFQGEQLCQSLNGNQLGQLLGSSWPISLTIVNLEKVREEMSRIGETDLGASYLSGGEQKRFQSFRYPKRKIEWLGGRIAAKYALKRLVDDQSQTPSAGQQLPFQGWAVDSDADGRPYIRSVADGIDKVLPDISISHNNGLAVAMAVSKGRCGVDIQKVVPSILKVKERFALIQEQDVLQKLACPGSESARLTLLWAAKEALKKAVGAHLLPGFMGIVLTGFIKINPEDFQDGVIFDFVRHASEERNQRDDEKQFKVVALFQGDFALACASL